VQGWIASFIGVCMAGSLLAGSAIAQGSHLGGQPRADAARRMIVLAVQQGISSLPPASGQALVYEYDHEKDTYARSAQLGPTVLRSPRPIGKGKLSIRLAASYLELAQRLEPIVYGVSSEPAAGVEPDAYVKLGLDAQARVGVLTLAATYGITPYIDASLVVPVTIVDAAAQQAFTTRGDRLGVPADEAVLTGARTRAGLDTVLADGRLAIRRESFRSLGFSFDESTNVGLGRISLATRAVVYATTSLRLALAPEIFLPSPSERELAGSESFAILPRAVGEWWVGGPVRLLADAGYDYDVRYAELRRFVASGGAQYSTDRVAIDLGFSGSIYDTPIRWSPAQAVSLPDGEFSGARLQALEGARLGDDFFDFVAGVRLRVTRQLAVSGAVSVPMNTQGLRPAAFGTLALEVIR